MLAAVQAKEDANKIAEAGEKRLAQAAAMKLATQNAVRRAEALHNAQMAYVITS